MNGKLVSAKSVATSTVLVCIKSSVGLYLYPHSTHAESTNLAFICASTVPNGGVSAVISELTPQQPLARCRVRLQPGSAIQRCRNSLLSSSKSSLCRWSPGANCRALNLAEIWIDVAHPLILSIRKLIGD